MPIFPEVLYRPRPIDLGAALARPFFRQSDVAPGTATITTDFPLFPDRFVILTTACMFITPGGAATINPGAIRALSPQGEVFDIALGLASTLLTQEETLSYSGQVLLPPGWTLRAFARFSAAVAGNALRFSATGVSIPRGTLDTP